MQLTGSGEADSHADASKDRLTHTRHERFPTRDEWAERHCFGDGKRADLLDATHLPCESHGRFFFFHSYVSDALASPILPVNNLWIFIHMPSSKHLKHLGLPRRWATRWDVHNTQRPVQMTARWQWCHRQTERG